jgi:hypothetical protein
LKVVTVDDHDQRLPPKSSEKTLFHSKFGTTKGCFEVINTKKRRMLILYPEKGAKTKQSESRRVT